jgi:NAD(P)-dependent dehydrogenase (short-subunit alcohol dehydrogenase family)
VNPTVALVTGAARGIGAATARALAEVGHRVHGIDLTWPEPPADDRIRPCTLDVSDPEAVGRFFTELDDDLARDGAQLRVLANVAGTVLVKPFLDTTWEDYRRVIDVNLGGTLLCCRHAAARMPPGSAIVNVASISGHIGQTQHAVYAASKGSILALCRALAWEFAPLGIRVNSISPGSVDTAMLRSDIAIEARRLGRSFDDIKAEREAEQSLGRWADPGEIASAIAFLAGGGASYVNGADLLVDSGWVAR